MTAKHIFTARAAAHALAVVAAFVAAYHTTHGGLFVTVLATVVSLALHYFRPTPPPVVPVEIPEPILLPRPLSQADVFRTLGDAIAQMPPGYHINALPDHTFIFWPDVLHGPETGQRVWPH